MADKHTPSENDLSFLAELDAQFGKKPKDKKSPTDLETRKARNAAWHIANPALQAASGKVPEVDLHYDWQAAKLGQYQPIIPVARVSYIVHQHCSTCQETSWFTGNEYIRFQRRVLRYKLLGVGEVQLPSTILRRLSDCDPDLVAFGPPNAAPLPQVIEEHHETVPRCPACIMLERHCVDLWMDDVKRKMLQPTLPGVESLVVPGLEPT